VCRQVRVAAWSRGVVVWGWWRMAEKVAGRRAMCVCASGGAVCHIAGVERHSAAAVMVVLSSLATTHGVCSALGAIAGSLPETRLRQAATTAEVCRIAAKKAPLRP